MNAASGSSSLAGDGLPVCSANTQLSQVWIAPLSLNRLLCACQPPLPLKQSSQKLTSQLYILSCEVAVFR